MAAMNAASVELVDSVDWTFNLYAIGPPQNINTKPVMDQSVVKSVPWAASTYPARVVGKSGCVKLGRVGSEIRATKVPIGREAR